MRRSLSDLAKSYRWSAIGSRIAAEQTSNLRSRVGRRNRLMGATHRAFSVEESVEYVSRVYADYRRYGSISDAELEGARVLEVGPGDSLAVSVRMIAGGAKEVVALDRFSTWRDPAQQAAILSHLVTTLPPEEVSRLHDPGASDAVAMTKGRVKLVEGVAIESAPAKFGASSFDLIVSRAVMEHVLDLEGAFAAMAELSAPGAVMAHKVDLTDHGMFTAGGQHPLTFLGIPDRTWSLMGAQSGLPNRRLMSAYREVSERLGLESQFLISALIDSPAELDPHVAEPDVSRRASSEREVESVRAKLLPRFQSGPASDLAVSGFFMRSQAPSH